MKITHEFIMAGATNGAGWKRSQLNLLGVEWPARAGWKHRVVGSEISDEAARQFLEIGSKMKKKRNAKPPEEDNRQFHETIESAVDHLKLLLADLEQIDRVLKAKGESDD